MRSFQCDEALEELWLNNNKIATIEQLEPLSKLTALLTLRLEGCPLAASEGYRESVRAAIHPGLEQLDADRFPRAARERD